MDIQNKKNKSIYIYIDSFTVFDVTEPLLSIIVDKNTVQYVCVIMLVYFVNIERIVLYQLVILFLRICDI